MMTQDQLRALAEALRPMAAAPCFDGIDIDRAADLRTVVTMLEGMADEKPALWMQSNHVSWAGKQPFMARCAPTQLHPDFVPVYLRPTPQSQPTEAQIEAATDAWQAHCGLLLLSREGARDEVLIVLRAALAAKDE